MYLLRKGTCVSGMPGLGGVLVALVGCGGGRGPTHFSDHTTCLLIVMRQKCKNILHPAFVDFHPQFTQRDQ